MLQVSTWRGNIVWSAVYAVVIEQQQKSGISSQIASSNAAQTDRVGQAGKTTLQERSTSSVSLWTVHCADHDAVRKPSRFQPTLTTPSPSRSTKPISPGLPRFASRESGAIGAAFRLLAAAATTLSMLFVMSSTRELMYCGRTEGVRDSRKKMYLLLAAERGDKLHPRARRVGCSFPPQDHLAQEGSQCVLPRANSHSPIKRHQINPKTRNLINRRIRNPQALLQTLQNTLIISKRSLMISLAFPSRRTPHPTTRNDEEPSSAVSTLTLSDFGRPGTSVCHHMAAAARTAVA